MSAAILCTAVCISAWCHELGQNVWNQPFVILFGWSKVIWTRFEELRLELTDKTAKWSLQMEVYLSSKFHQLFTTLHRCSSFSKEHPDPLPTSFGWKLSTFYNNTQMFKLPYPLPTSFGKKIIYFLQQCTGVHK